MTHSRQRWALPSLAAGAALGNIGLAAIATSGAVLLVEVTGRESLAGLPLALTTLGAAAAALAITRLTVAVGRSSALLAGYVCGGVGALAVVAGASSGASSGVLLGNLLMGGAVTATALTRYAAAAVADPRRQGRSLSVAVAMGAVGAVAGPNLFGPAARAVRALGLAADAGLYALAIPALVLAATATWCARALNPVLGRPPPPGDVAIVRVGVLRVVLSAGTRSHVVALATANLVMVGAMSVVPLHMAEDGHGHGTVGAVVSLHLLAMFAPSPLTGRWADRIGGGPVATGGLVVSAAACLLLSARVGSGPLLGTGAALTLLGVGWNLAFVGGSAALVQSVPGPVRAQVEGPVEAMVALAAAVGAAGAGLVHTTSGLGAVGWTGAALSTVAVVVRAAGSFKTQARVTAQSRVITPNPTSDPTPDPTPDEGVPMLTVHMIVTDADAASRWYADVLGFEERSRVELPDGRLIDVVLRTPTAGLTLADEFPEHGALAPHPGATPVVLYLDVAPVDEVWDRALGAGAVVRRPLADAFWGAREGQFVDPFGHVWGVTEHTRDVSPAELSKLAAAAFSGAS